MALISGAVYFALVFLAGFVLGTIRVPFLVPRLGLRTAELLEMPLMLAVIYLAARFTVRRFALTAATPTRLGTGLVALAFLVLAELATARLLLGKSPKAVFAGRDPVAGAAYLASILLLALMPLLVHRRPEA